MACRRRERGDGGLGGRPASDALADDGVDEVVESAAVAAAREADEVADERRVRPLAAFVRRDPRKLEEGVDLVAAELVVGPLAAALARETIPRSLQPFVHPRDRSAHERFRVASGLRAAA